MSAPRATRPYMPGYGLRHADEGTGLLPWAFGLQTGDFTGSPTRWEFGE